MTDIDAPPAPVLPRELTSTSDEVRAVGAPPTPILAEPYCIRLVDPAADADMVSDEPTASGGGVGVRLAAGEVAAPPTSPAGRRVLAAVHRILPRQAVRLSRAVPRREGFHRAALELDTDPHDIGLHAAIAEMRFVNRGIAPILLPRLVANIFEIEPRCGRIMFDPNHRNSGARRVCEYAGGVFLGEHDMSNRRMAL